MFKSIKNFFKALTEPVPDEFDNVKRYDFTQQIIDDKVDSMKRTKEIEYEKFIKFTSSRDKLVEHYVVFDLETTGLSASKEDIIEIGAIKFDRDEPIEVFNTLVRPNKSIRKKITDLTGITAEDVASAPTIEDILPHFLNFIEDYTLIAHNATFDMEFISDKLYKNNYKKIPNKVIDTLPLSRKYIRDVNLKKLKSYSLESLCEELDIWYESHRAIGDCRSCADVYKECKKEINYESLNV